MFLSSWYPSKEHPTLGTFVQRHCKAVSLYTQITLIYVTASERNKIETKYRHNLSEIIVYHKRKIPLISHLIALKKAYSKAKQLNGNFDLIHLHVAYPTGVFVLFLNLPYIVTEHFTGYLPTSKFKWCYWKKFVTKIILNKARLLLPVSEDLGNALLKFSPKSNFQKISNVVDTSIFYPMSSKSEVFTFLHISTLNEETKNISNLLDAMSLLQRDKRSFKFLIGGDGDIRELQRKIKAKKLDLSRIEVFSAKSSQGIAELMSQSNCFVLSSHIENQPCVILEALCCGLPIISTNVGGIKEEVSPENGILVEPHNTQKLYEAMLRMMDTYSHYNLVQIAQKAKKHYSNKTIGKKLMEIYSNVLNKDS